jgi:hypothetical protein
MSQPLYFLPHLQWNREQNHAMTRQILKMRGLAEVFSDVSHDQILSAPLAGRGPGELSGSVIAYQTVKGEPPRRIGYYPGEQKWTPIGDGSLCWIGIDTDSPPTPDDLRRRKEHGSYRLELGDGNTYAIPVVRRPHGGTELPTDMYLDATGALCEPIKPAYEVYWESAAEVCEWYFGDFDSSGRKVREFHSARALQLAVDVLSLNYRYSMQEQNVLRLIDKENFQTVLMCSIDWPAVRDEMLAQKKT